MSKSFSEFMLEDEVINFFSELGWNYYKSTELDNEFNRSKDEVIYWELLKEIIININDGLSENNVDDFISSLKRDLNYQNLLEGNKEFLRLLRKGKKFTLQLTDKDGNTTRESRYIKLIDFDNISKNEFIITNQFVVRNKNKSVPDIVAFINGIPIVIGELKSLAKDSDYIDAVKDLKAYEKNTPRLFIPSIMNIAIDSTDFRYGATGASVDHYYPWNETVEQYKDIENNIKKSIFSIFNHETILDIIKYYTFYSNREGKTIKVLPRYMQYYASNRIVDRVSRGKYNRGLIWHTQGSGKTYTMLFTSYKIQKTQPINYPKIIILVDRSNLNKQIMMDMNSIEFPNFEVADNSSHLSELLSNDSSLTIVSTIQKFSDLEITNEADNIIILSDEAHRFMEKKLGSKLEKTLPNAHNYGFTGTPVKESDRNTFKNFMPDDTDEIYLHRYSIAEGLKDKLILPVYFELKDPVWDDLTEEDFRDLDIEFNEEFHELDVEEKNNLVLQYINKSSLAEIRPRVRKIINDISDHFTNKFEDTPYKGMIVTPSKRAAALYKEELDKIRNPEDSEVIYSPGNSSDEDINRYYKSPDEIDNVVDKFKDEKNGLKILIVCNMLLTGFDAPILKVMYLDKQLKNHSLLQAIARTNRPRDGKNNGLIVDFQRVFENLDDALDYDLEVRNNAAFDESKLKEEFERLLEETINLFSSIKFSDLGHSNAAKKCLNLIIKDPELKKSFIENYRKLQNLYETISPDKFLVRNDIADAYELITEIFLIYRRNINKEENPENELRQRTLELVEKHAKIDTIKENNKIYRLSYEHLEKLRGIEDVETRASQAAGTLQEYLDKNMNLNPSYVRISDRVKEVISKWQKGEIEDQEAAEELLAYEEEVIEVKHGADKMDMTEGEYAIYCHLTDNYPDKIGNEKAQIISKDIGQKFGKIDFSMKDWHKNEQIKKNIRGDIIEVIIQNDMVPVLYKESDFPSVTREYLIDNKLEESI